MKKGVQTHRRCAYLIIIIISIIIIIIIIMHKTAGGNIGAKQSKWLQ